MHCFVDGCPFESSFVRGGFCARHWKMLTPSRQGAIKSAIAELRRSRSDAIAVLQPGRSLRDA
jgi:hypothetical protein